MSVWLTIPSKRPPEEAEPILKLWRERGYKIALWRDYAECKRWPLGPAEFALTGDSYPGYAASVNAIVAHVIKAHPDAEWFIAAGDDIEPDLNHTAEEIWRQCSDHFRNRNIEATGETFNVHPTYGVMQPTGDRWGDKQGAYIDRVCGSAWIGREFARRVNQGNGPLWPEYFHMGCDEELQAVAIKYGVFWQRPDLIQLHKHWGRARAGEVMGQRDRMPAFLERANSDVEWAKYKKLYAERQAADFPGSELL